MVLYPVRSALLERALDSTSANPFRYKLVLPYSTKTSVSKFQVCAYFIAVPHNLSQILIRAVAIL